MRVLWGTDGSAASEAAIPLLRALFDAREHALIVVTAAPVPLLAEGRPDPALLLWHWIPGYRDRVASEVTDLVTEQLRALEGLRAEVTSTIRLGAPATEIVAAAEEQTADLIVLGSHGHSGARELLLGSVARQVASHARCSVLVARGRRRPRRFLIAYDGSPDADAAVDVLAALRPPRGAEVTVLHLAEPPAAAARAEWAGEALAGLQAQERAGARALTSRAARRLRASGWTVRTRMREGRPAPGILEAAADLAPDLLLVGARGVHSPDFLARGAGGVALQVLEHAPCSVLVARRPRPG